MEKTVQQPDATQNTNDILEGYPVWARDLAQKYLSRTVNQFLLHGNVYDLVEVTHEQGAKSEFVSLKSFLADELFGSRDYVIFYDRSSGIYFRDEASRRDFNQALAGRDSLVGTEYAQKMPRDPVRVFSLLEQYFRTRIEDQKSVACIINYAETVVPNNEAGMAAPDDRTALVYLAKWAHDPLFLAADFTLTLTTENLADLHRSLVQNPYTSEIRIERPDYRQRLNYIDLEAEKREPDFDKLVKVDRKVLAQQTAGLNFINIQSIIANATENREPLTLERLSATKKELIEAEAYNLLEFIETDYTLDAVAGHSAVKKHLRQASKALKSGRPDVLPMGYLVSGPVGTGKTFLVTSFAGEVGIPMVRLKNFRSQWQGVTEGNLQKILALFQAMAPVAVMIDEADAYLGNRQASGDSGVSSRVFSQIAAFMSNTENRGRILWFLMTARPDLMPVDLKRQGRAEEHLALFHPQSREERLELFEAMKKKTNLRMTKNHVPKIITGDKVVMSGADMEAALTRAKFRAASRGNIRVTPEILEETFNDFMPPTYPEEVELQTLSSVVECTSRSMLPQTYANMDREDILSRIEELKMEIGR